jgi:hypothetical protein
MGGHQKYIDPPPRPTRPSPDSRFVFPGSELTPDEIEFGRAVDEWRRTHRHPDGSQRFPSCRDFLAIAIALGYRRDHV